MTVMIESNAAQRPAENGATQAKDTYEKATAATQDLPKHFQDTSSKLAQGAQNYTGRLIELARTNTNALRPGAARSKISGRVRRSLDRIYESAIRGIQ